MLCGAGDLLNGAELSEGLEQVVMAMRFSGQITHVDHVTVETVVQTLRDTLVQIQTELVYGTPHLKSVKTSSGNYSVCATACSHLQLQLQ